MPGGEVESHKNGAGLGRESRVVSRASRGFSALRPWSSAPPLQEGALEPLGMVRREADDAGQQPYRCQPCRELIDERGLVVADAHHIRPELLKHPELVVFMAEDGTVHSGLGEHGSETLLLGKIWLPALHPLHRAVPPHADHPTP